MERAHSSDLAAELASSLDWWAEAGIDSWVSDEPFQWLKPVASPDVMPAPAGTLAQIGGAPALPRDADLPDQLPLFLDWLLTSDDTPYATPSAPRVCPAGDPAAGLMILTGMPSTEDCGAGTLVSGAPGRLFDRMLAAIGRGRDSVYLAGLSCLRPAGGRFDPAGAARCADMARHHVALAQPKALLLLGDAAPKALLGLGAAQARGRVHQLDAGGRSFKVIVTLHPEILLQQPHLKALAWADLQLLMEVLS